MTGDAIADATPDLVDLRDLTAQAIRDLDGLDFTGPDADTARRAIRLTRLTLEWFWLPAIDAELEHHPSAGSERPG